MKEKYIQTKYVTKLRKNGFFCIKNTKTLPDFTVIDHFGNTFFIEFKATKGRLSKRQEMMFNYLRERGTYIIIASNNNEELDNLISNYSKIYPYIINKSYDLKLICNQYGYHLRHGIDEYKLTNKLMNKLTNVPRGTYFN